MCPVCLATLVMAAAGASSAGSGVVVVAMKLRKAARRRRGTEGPVVAAEGHTTAQPPKGAPGTQTH